MNRPHNNSNDDDDEEEEEEFEDTKAMRQRRFNNKTKHGLQRDFDELKIKPIGKRRRVNTIRYDPDFDDDDYEDYYDD